MKSTRKIPHLPSSIPKTQVKSDNHSLISATLLALLSPLCEYTLSFPIKYSSNSVDFPKIRTIKLTNGIVLEVYKTIKERIKQQRLSYGKDLSELPRLSYERRFEFFHFLLDLMTLFTDCKLKNYNEEHTGISGDFEIVFPSGKLDKNQILTIGKHVLEKLYGNRSKHEKLRTIPFNMLTDTLPENVIIANENFDSSKNENNANSNHNVDDVEIDNEMNDEYMNNYINDNNNLNNNNNYNEQDEENEFVEHILKMCPNFGENLAKEWFHAVDKDKNGTLDV